MEMLIIVGAIFSFVILNLVLPAGAAAAISFIPAVIALMLFTLWKNRNQ